MSKPPAPEGAAVRPFGPDTSDELASLRAEVERLNETIRAYRIAADVALAKLAEMRVREHYDVNVGLMKDRDREKARADKAEKEVERLRMTLDGAVTEAERSANEADADQREIARLREVLREIADCACAADRMNGQCTEVCHDIARKAQEEE